MGNNPEINNTIKEKSWKWKRKTQNNCEARDANKSWSNIKQQWLIDEAGDVDFI